MTGTAWTPEQDAQLRALWANHAMSARAIGERLGLSKNAVLGRVHRLKLPGRVSPIKPRGAGDAPAARRQAGGGADHAPARVAAASLAAPRSDATPSSPPAPNARPGGGSSPRCTPQPGEAPAAAPRPFLPPRVTSFARRCQFPLWPNGAKPDGRFCAAPAIAGSSYCAVCHDRTHTAPHAWVRSNLVGFARPGRAA
jgi:GcrA cell cycle regulator